MSFVLVTLVLFQMASNKRTRVLKIPKLMTHLITVRNTINKIQYFLITLNKCQTHLLNKSAKFHTYA